MWVRGLKYLVFVDPRVLVAVAPHVGAWIEMKSGACVYLYRPASSHPMWVRGLKYARPPERLCGLQVAPHVGAWIEMLQLATPGSQTLSHPMWVRGLKFGLAGYP